jgi:hypothetical protein
MNVCMHACMYVGTYIYTDTMVNIKILASSGASFSVPIPHSLNPQAQSLNPQNICTHAHRHTHTHTHTHTNTRARARTHTHTLLHTHTRTGGSGTHAAQHTAPEGVLLLQKVFSYYKRCSLTTGGSGTHAAQHSAPVDRVSAERVQAGGQFRVQRCANHVCCHQG